MLIAAGVLFVLAMLLLFADKYLDLASIDLAWPIRLLLLLALSIVVYYVYKNPQLLKELQDIASF